MNTAEFNEWAKHFGQAFPDISGWLHAMKDRVSVVEIWRQVLASVELADAKSATMALVRGDEPAIAAYERETTPQRILQLANGYRAARLASRQRALALPYSPPETKTGPSCLAALRNATEARQRGQDWRAVVAAEFAADPEDHNTRRAAYRCRLCRDTGVRYVWGMVAVADMVAGTFGSAGSYSPACTGCECAAGDPLCAIRQRKNGSQSPSVPRFDATKYCPWDDNDLAQSEANLREWCAVKLSFEAEIHAPNTETNPQAVLPF